jgi:hypothetical protein
VKGSPLWDDKPPLQMFYAMSRDWARMYCTDIVAGVYTREELIEQGFSDVTTPSDLAPGLRARLRGPTGPTDITADIDAAIKSARVDSKKTGKPEKTGGDAETAASSGSELPNTDVKDDAATVQPEQGVST